jgi:hypothetical protein
VLAGTTTEEILNAWRTVRDTRRSPTRPPLWDGRAAERIAAVLDEKV